MHLFYTPHAQSLAGRLYVNAPPFNHAYTHIYARIHKYHTSSSPSSRASSTISLSCRASSASASRGSSCRFWGRVDCFISVSKPYPHNAKYIHPHPSYIPIYTHPPTWALSRAASVTLAIIASCWSGPACQLRSSSSTLFNATSRRFLLRHVGWINQSVTDTAAHTSDGSTQSGWIR